MASDVLLRRLREALAQGPTLRIAILFGSRATGRARPDSDVDVAILPAHDGLSLADENALAAELERTTGTAVDLVRIDHASEALRWRIARDGVVLFSDPPEAAIRFRARAGIAHDEVRDLAIDAMRRFRSRVAALGPESSR